MAEFIKIKDIKPHPENPREHTEEQIQKIANSIKELDWGRPIIISSDNYILAGEGAYLAAKNVLKYKEVPFRRMKHMHNSPEAIAYMLADNKLGEESDWNYGKLQSINDDLRIKGFDVTLTGFEEEELQEIDSKLSKDVEVKEDNFDPDEDEIESIVKKGEIWQLGKHRLICGDATNKAVISALINNEKVGMVFTDPPYDFEGDFLKNCFDICDQHIFVMDGDKNHARNLSIYKDYFNVFYCIHFKVPTWNLSKLIPLTNHVLIAQYKGKNAKNRELLGLYSVIEVTTKNDRSEKEYQAKNLETIVPFIKNFSDKNDIILDVFGGSGSILIACEQLERKCYINELDPHKCDTIIKRYEEFTNKKAKKIS